MLFTPYDRVGLSLFALSTILIGSSGGVRAQNNSAATFSPNPGLAPPPNGGAQASGGAQDGFSQQSKQLTSTFTDPRTGQLYGRYIIYESVPVVKYQQKQVTEKQWVPEWVAEPKQTTQTTYTPVVTYQLQLQTERTLNPFVQPRQYWQYVPVVQYQANHSPVTQQVTYQKYVEKEFTKIIPELVATTQQVPRFADLPMTNQPNATTASLPNGMAVNSSIAPTAQVAMAAPPAYYAINSIPGNSASGVVPGNAATASISNGGTVAPTNVGIANSPAFNPAMGGWNTANPMLSANPYPTGYVANGQFVNNPYPNAGLPANQYVAAMPQTQSFQWPQFMTRTGSIFQGGLLRNNTSVPSSYSGNAYGSGSYIATNPYGSYQSQVFPTLNSSTINNGATFTPNGYSSTYGSVNNGNWSVTPVNNFRDPTQTGIPASYLR